jgi:Na+/melibiose symporter-like transporter
MSNTGDSIESRVAAVEKEYAARQSRLFLRFAMVEGALLLIAVLVVYVFEVVDPEIGVWILVAIAAVGGFALSALLVRHMQSRAKATARAKGENPLF